MIQPKIWKISELWTWKASEINSIFLNEKEANPLS